MVKSDTATRYAAAIMARLRGMGRIDAAGGEAQDEFEAMVLEPMVRRGLDVEPHVVADSIASALAKRGLLSDQKDVEMWAAANARDVLESVV